jgi:HEAT repeat protein/adenylate kinase family enzyme
MNLEATPPLSLEDLLTAAKKLIAELDAQKLGYSDPRKESFHERISKEILFRWKNLGEAELDIALEHSLPPFAENGFWTAAKKLAAPRFEKTLEVPDMPLSFLVPFEAFLLAVERDSLRCQGEAFVSPWDRESQKLKTEAGKQFQELEGAIDSILTDEEKRAFLAKSEQAIESSPSIAKSVSALVAEERRLFQSIDRLLEKAGDPKEREDALSALAEKIQPPRGIVTDTSPALLFPCIYLLLNRDIDITSGIPYAASVILSILQDSRSSGPLLAALGSFPLEATRIRENIIYALGKIKIEKGVEAIAEVLDAPDETIVSSNGIEKNVASLLEEKEEGIWALGKLGFASLSVLLKLKRYADHPSPKIRTLLAWSLGEIGKEQKEKLGGVSSDILIALLELLKSKNKDVFIESVSAMKKIEMPQFIHALYLYHAGAVSLLGLKPAQKGLYELSETLHYLLQSKKRVILAVNGDSGTGKTYFCQSIINGFGVLKCSDILYLMRDSRQGRQIFNRILGLAWLKKYIDPCYYHDYPLAEENDDPEAFFQQFLEDCSDKRLIILDGCRDSLYFQRVIDFFYSRGQLDVEVNFRANFSTRRHNLEAREIALESVRTHLQFLEEPALEDTPFYQEGIVILYDLDNSISSRLSSEEVQELFKRQRIDSWGDLIQLGNIGHEAKSLPLQTEKLSFERQSGVLRTEEWNPEAPRPFSQEEKKVSSLLNDDLDHNPNLLKTIALDEIKPCQIRFYAQEQLAGMSEGGSIFVLSFLDNRIFETHIEAAQEIALLGRNIYIAAKSGELLQVSFERNEITLLARTLSPAIKIAPWPRDRILTAHADASIRVWDMLQKNVQIIEGSGHPALALAGDHEGRIYSAGAQRGLCRWDLINGELLTAELCPEDVRFLKLYPGEKILAFGCGKDVTSLKIVDFNAGTARVISEDFGPKVSGVNVYFDGRIIFGTHHELVILSPQQEGVGYRTLKAHGLEIKDCLVAGPQIISVGQESPDHHTLRIWGTEFYVRREIGKSMIRGQTSG